MTFTEAAEAVLRKVGKALHYKKITQFAIEQNLLSHIGKTPEVTMSTRLATLAKKDRGDQNIVRVRPGIFALREWGAAATAGVDDGDAEATEAPATAAPAAPVVPAAAAAPAAASGAPGGRGRGRGQGRGGEGRRGEGRKSAAPPAPTPPVATPVAAEPSAPALTGEAPLTPRLVAAEPAEAAEELSPVETTRAAPAPAPVRAPANEEEEELAPRNEEELEREERLAAAAEMFPDEEDDEEPLLGGPDKTDGGRRRRRRRRRGGARGPEGATPGAPGAPAPGAAADATPGSADDAMVAAATSSEPAEARAPRPTEEFRRDEPREEGRRDEPRREEGRREEGRRDEPRRDEPRRDEGRRDEPRRDEPRRDEPRRDDARRDDARRDDEIGRDAADLLVSMLTRREDRQPVPLRTLVDEAIRTGRLGGDPAIQVAAMSAAARVDGVRREARGERPRLRIANGRVGLVDWTLPPELVRAEVDALAALERLRDTARRYVVRRLNDLPQASFTEMVVLLLERLGISSLRTTRRPGLPQGEVHLAGVSRRGPEEIRVAVVIKRSGEVGRERVIELWGPLHHYGPATATWILTTGNVLSGAREEAAQPGTAPVTLVDGVALGRMLDEQDVLVRHANVTLPYLDVDLFDSLRNV